MDADNLPMNRGMIPHEFRGQHEWEGERLASRQRFKAHVHARGGPGGFP